MMTSRKVQLHLDSYFPVPSVYMANERFVKVLILGQWFSTETVGPLLLYLFGHG